MCSPSKEAADWKPVFWLACKDHSFIPLSLHWVSASALPAPGLLLTKMEATIAKKCAHTWRKLSQLGSWPCLWPGKRLTFLGGVYMYTLRKEQKQFSVAAPTPVAIIQSQTKADMSQKEWNKLRIVAPRPGALSTPPTKVETAVVPRRSQFPHGSCSSGLGPSPNPYRAVTDNKPKRNPSLQLAQVPAPLYPALLQGSSHQCTPKGDSTCDHIKSNFLPPKIQGTGRLCRDGPTQGHAFKTWKVKSFT